ncbi:MAG: cytidine deaminase [Firmicutes bacterium HGW-Firmicutes-16]|nr:MAG: cytidine deaminase [Firmicutes bacterium HGW-Firmicutes-16]
MESKLKKELIVKAAEARLKARAFSGFHVGAALMTVSGEVFTGCNVEIQSTLSSICAERCAIVKAVSEGYTDFVAIVVVSDAEHPVSPCGFCRQYLIDFNPDMEVVMANVDGSEVLSMTAGELMPRAFVGSGRD